MPEKALRIQALVEDVAFHSTGIMYSMQRLVDGEIRPFRPEDFAGEAQRFEIGGSLSFEGPGDYLHGENSITTSGIYLASQAYRVQVEGTPQAREQAEKAFHSLEIIFEMGVDCGKPGWMCKPYGFRPSSQTSPDQYSDACWGLYAYHAVAPAAHQRRIEEMIAAFADYWRGAGYGLDYFGGAWSLRNDRGYGNATMLLINALAYHFTGNPAYLREAEWFRDHQHWMTRSDAVALREKIEADERETGAAHPIGNQHAPFATALLEPGEALFWETAGLCKFVANAAEIVHEVQPNLIEGSLPLILEQWWEQGQYGMGPDLLPWYWFAADVRRGTWRPLPTTNSAPREQWGFGDPFMSRVSGVRWCEPLARLMVTSVIASAHAPEIAGAATQQARVILDAIDEKRLHWMIDPDGEQLPPEISYFGQCLSSEVPASSLAAFWRGRRDGLW